MHHPLCMQPLSMAIAVHDALEYIHWTCIDLILDINGLEECDLISDVLSVTVTHGRVVLGEGIMCPHFRRVFMVFHCSTG